MSGGVYQARQVIQIEEREDGVSFMGSYFDHILSCCRDMCTHSGQEIPTGKDAQKSLELSKRRIV